MDASAGIILSPPNLPGWDRIEICNEITHKLGGRAHLMNDANACALAEWHYGAGKGCKHMVFLTAGTGMGAGLILNGKLYEGVTGEAGEVGHIRLCEDGPTGYGKSGSFEGFCSGGGIARNARIKLKSWENRQLPDWATIPDQITTQKIAEAAWKNDPLALILFTEAGEKLGEAASILIDILNPERIVIGGIFPRCEALLRPSMQWALDSETLKSPLSACQIVPAILGETIGSHGAIAAALYREGLLYDHEYSTS